MIVTNRTIECPFCGRTHRIELVQCPYCMKPEIKTGEKIMKFDPNKVLTVFTKDQASKGDWGWFGDSEYGLIQRVGVASYLQELKLIDKNTPYIFKTLNNGYEYFYPAPYEFLQAKWVEKNSLKVGDSVYINKGWKKGEKGFDSKYDCDIPICQSYWVTRIYDDCMVVATKHKAPVDNNHDITKFDWCYRNTAEYFVPYFAIEKVTAPTYAERQARWVKENDLKVGDLVTVPLAWWLEEEKRRFPKVDEILKVAEIRKTTLVCVPTKRVDTTSDTPCYHLPYHGVEKAEYRPFANAEEFDPYHNEVFVFEDNNGRVKVVNWGDRGIYVSGGVRVSWAEFYDWYTFLSTGEPAGVKL